jgi:hypothetical protein
MLCGFNGMMTSLKSYVAACMNCLLDLVEQGVTRRAGTEQSHQTLPKNLIARITNYVGSSAAVVA